jgi:hypothetical protein
MCPSRPTPTRPKADRSTGTRSLFLSGNLIRPSLSAGRLAFVRTSGGGQTLYVRTISSGATTVVTHVPAGTDISGPSLSGV